MRGGALAACPRAREPRACRVNYGYGPGYAGLHTRLRPRGGTALKLTMSETCRVHKSPVKARALQPRVMADRPEGHRVKQAGRWSRMARFGTRFGSRAAFGALALALALVGVPVASAFATAEDPSAALSEEQVAKGRQMFMDNGCNACHALADANA